MLGLNVQFFGQKSKHYDLGIFSDGLISVCYYSVRGIHNHFVLKFDEYFKNAKSKWHNPIFNSRLLLENALHLIV